MRLGLWLVWRSLAKRAYYLQVVESGRTRKLVFNGKESLPAIEGFLAEAGTRFGFACESRLIQHISYHAVFAALALTRANL